MPAPRERRLTLPNLLSLFRVVAAPVLLWLGWTGRPNAFLALVGASFLSDVLDGWLARRLGQVSARGARLDTVGDFVSYLAIPLAGWWLWADRLRPELPVLAVLALSYASPIAVGFLKYRRLTSHRTWAGRLSAWLLGAGALLLIAGVSPWPFRLAVAVVVLADIEEIAITALLPAGARGGPSLYHVLRARTSPPP
ncbi:MAG: CDP-alcohol phosphatidyltransferase family protein [Candidatus Binatia bacterium]